MTLPGAEQQSVYCVKCKAKQPVRNAQVTTMANGKPALKGQCSVCGTNVQVFLPATKK